MTANIALGLSILGMVWWFAVIIAIRRVFKKLYPVFEAFGITKSQNLTFPAIGAKMSEAPKLGDAKIEKN